MISGRRHCPTAAAVRSIRNIDADSVCGRRERKSAASPSRGGIKIKSTLRNAPNTHKYTSMTDSTRCMRRLVKKLTAGSMAEAMTMAVMRIRTRSFKNHKRAAKAKNRSTVMMLPEVIWTLMSRGFSMP